MSLSNRMLVGILQESGSYGNCPLSGSDPSGWLAVSACTLTPDITIVENSDVTAVYSGRKNQTITRACDVSVDFKMTARTGSIGAEQASKYFWSPFLGAAGFSETLVTGDTPDSYQYLPSSANDVSTAPPMSLVKYQIHDDDTTTSRKSVAAGVKGNLSFDYTMGQEAKINFVGKGQYFDYPSSTTTTPTIPSEYSGEVEGMVVKGMTFTLDATAYCVENFNVSTNWTIGEDECATATPSVDEMFLHRGTGARMGGSMTMKGRTGVLNTILPKIASGAEIAMIVTLSGSAGECKMTMPKVQLQSASESDDGRIKYDVAFALNGEFDGASENGNNELSIKTY